MAGENFYAYVHNQATNLTDPRGLQQGEHLLFTCTCTRAIVKPVPSRPNSKILICEYFCDCIDGKFVVLFNRIRRLKGCKDAQSCPFQIEGTVDPVADSPILIPDPGKTPVLEPPKK